MEHTQIENITDTAAKNLPVYVYRLVKKAMEDEEIEALLGFIRMHGKRSIATLLGVDHYQASYIDKVASDLYDEALGKRFKKIENSNEAVATPVEKPRPNITVSDHYAPNGKLAGKKLSFSAPTQAGTEEEEEDLKRTPEDFERFTKEHAEAKTELMQSALTYFEYYVKGRESAENDIQKSELVTDICKMYGFSESIETALQFIVDYQYSIRYGSRFDDQYQSILTNYNLKSFYRSHYLSAINFFAGTDLQQKDLKF